MKTLFDNDLSYEDAVELIQNGAEVNANYIYEWPPLHKVANIEISKLLIDNGADVNAKDAYGRTPLFCDYISPCLGKAELLIKHGADINTINSAGKTIVSW